MEDRRINILMATYNGERFIEQQLQSIIGQTYKNWRLFIRDDASTDETLNIIRNYQIKDERIQLITDNLGNLGSCQNFSLLMNSIKNSSGYIMFTDQDDVWLPDKISDTLNEMTFIEDKYGKKYPLLVYTNFSYVDEELKLISSKKNFSATKIKNLRFTNILAQSPIYGCTVMLNKKLADVIKYIPSTAENHDYWIALVASAFGKISYLNKKTILYRQHGKNISGHHDNNSFWKRVDRILVNKKNFEDAQSKMQMALDFANIYCGSLSSSHKKAIEDFINFYKTKAILLLWKNIRNGVRRQTITQTVLFYISVLLLKTKEEFNENCREEKIIIEKF
jgi:glycosyltransferase involved in cell wall biosynthesis